MGNMEVLFENVTKEQDNCDIVGSSKRCCVCRTGKNNVHYKNDYLLGPVLNWPGPW